MSLLNNLAALLFVPKCVFCGKVLDDGGLCADCRRALPYSKGTVKNIEFITECVTAVYYRSDVRKSLHRYKFSGKSAYAAEYARLLGDTIKSELSEPFDVITYVPVSARRERSRGYDQSRLLAEELSRILGVKSARLLRKTRDNKKQSGIDGRERRRANVAGVYEAADREAIRDRRVLIIDDIVTTGATLSECARTLLMAGAEDVSAAAFANAMKKSQ